MTYFGKYRKWLKNVFWFHRKKKKESFPQAIANLLDFKMSIWKFHLWSGEHVPPQVDNKSFVGIFWKVG